MNPALFAAGMAAFALSFALTLLILRLVLVCGWLEDE